MADPDDPFGLPASGQNDRYWPQAQWAAGVYLTAQRILLWSAGVWIVLFVVPAVADESSWVRTVAQWAVFLPAFVATGMIALMVGTRWWMRSLRYAFGFTEEIPRGVGTARYARAVLAGEHAAGPPERG